MKNNVLTLPIAVIEEIETRWPDAKIAISRGWMTNSKLSELRARALAHKLDYVHVLNECIISDVANPESFETLTLMGKKAIQYTVRTDGDYIYSISEIESLVVVSQPQKR